MKSCWTKLRQINKGITFGAAMAPWLCLRLPFCSPRFESQAHHLTSTALDQEYIDRACPIFLLSFSCFIQQLLMSLINLSENSNSKQWFELIGSLHTGDAVGRALSKAFLVYLIRCLWVQLSYSLIWLDSAALLCWISTRFTCFFESKLVKKEVSCIVILPLMK